MDEWETLEELFHAALAVPSEQRAKFLQEACPNDERLRGEVLALLERASRDDSFLETSPLSTTPEEQPRLIGKTLGTFSILGLIGRGGMGEVFRAQDTKLQREVALKLLPETLLLDPDRRTRFEREAQAASALNHPNICTIYGFEEYAPHLVIVMELIEGATLASRLAKGPLPTDQALAAGIQLADALDAAHSKGIVHRDLKPGNLMLTKSGIKVLDFGLAKLDKPLASKQHHTITQSKQGAVFGTPQYMSPEQVLGVSVDSRSDIFSFGLVLYELLTGKPAFQAANWSGLIGAILHTEPVPIRDAQPRVRKAVERVVTTCLAKNPEDRFQSARDLKRALEWARDSDTNLIEASAARPRVKVWIASTVLACAVAVSAFLWPRRPPELNAHNWLAVISAGEFTDVGTPVSHPIVAPDGSAILYNGRKSFWMRRSESAEPIPLGWTASIEAPFWSFDSEHLGYISHGMLLKRRLPDGAEEKVCDLPPGSGRRGGSWSQNGTIVFDHVGALYAVSAAGGTPVKLEFPNLKSGVALWPEFLPNGEDLLFLWRSKFGDPEPSICLAKLRNLKVIKGPTVLMKNPTAAHFAPSAGGKLLFVKNDNLFAQQINLNGWTVTGEPRLVAQAVGSSPGFYAPDFSVSRTGVLAWRPGTAALRRLTWFDRKGNVVGVSGNPGLSTRVRLSKDETQILTAAEDATFILQRVGAGFRKLNMPYPIWGPDGSKLFYLEETTKGDMRVLEAAADGSPSVQEVTRLPSLSELHDVSPDGRFLLYLSVDNRLYYVEIDNGPGHGSVHLAAQTDEGIVQGRFSPNGRWLMFASGGEITVQDFPNGKRRTVVASQGRFPIWRGDGKEIVFVRGSQVFSCQVDGNGPEFRASGPRIMFTLRYPPPGVLRRNPLALSRDGSQILIVQPVAQPTSEIINISTGWDRPVPFGGS